MFGIGGFELFLILIFGFLIFGPDKLPEIGKTVGKAIAKFRNAQEEMQTTLNKQSFIDKDSDEPFKNPLEVLENAATDAKAKGEKVAAQANAAVEMAAEKSASFAERKAAYERERAARKAAEKAAGEAEKADDVTRKAVPEKVETEEAGE